MPKALSVLNTEATYKSKISDDWNTKKRMEREKKEEETGVNRNHNLVNMIIESSNSEANSNVNYDVLKERVRAMEEHAYRKEKYLNIKSSGVNNYTEVNSMIITSIKAKLAMLKGI